jgi:hypothetical protein
MSGFGAIIPKPSKQVVDIFIEPVMKQYEPDGSNEKPGDFVDSPKDIPE